MQELTAKYMEEMAAECSGNRYSKSFEMIRFQRTAKLDDRPCPD